jgi:hypothetical protein
MNTSETGRMTPLRTNTGHAWFDPEITLVVQIGECRYTATIDWSVDNTPELDEFIMLEAYGERHELPVDVLEQLKIDLPSLLEQCTDLAREEGII